MVINGASDRSRNKCVLSSVKENGPSDGGPLISGKIIIYYSASNRDNAASSATIVTSG